MRLLIATAALSLLALDALAGWFGLGGTSWQEEVLLHDGAKIVVDRSVALGGPHEIGQRGSYTKETLAFTHPVTGRLITWEDKATPDLRTSNFLPMALDIYQGMVYLVATPMGCPAYNTWGRPNPPYVVFKYVGNTWERIPLQELPPETKAPNLISSSPDTEVERLGKHFIDAETIKRINSEYRQPHNKAILREPLSKERIEQMCMEMVLYKGSWVMPNDPVARDFIDKQLNRNSH